MGTPAEHWYYAGRDHVFFAVEADIYCGELSALALPAGWRWNAERLAGSRELASSGPTCLPTKTSGSNSSVMRLSLRRDLNLRPGGHESILVGYPYHLRVAL